MREPTIPYLDGPDLSKPVKATVTTSFNEAEIEQRLSLPGVPNYTTRILKLHEAGVREALVRLGWTPPDGEAFLHRPDRPHNYHPHRGRGGWLNRLAYSPLRLRRCLV